MDNHGAMKKKANQLAEWLEKEWPSEEKTFERFFEEIFYKESFLGVPILNDEEILEYA